MPMLRRFGTVATNDSNVAILSKSVAFLAGSFGGAVLAMTYDMGVIKGEMRELGSGLRGEMKDLRSEMKDLKEELRGEMKDLKIDLFSMSDGMEKRLMDAIKGT